MKADLLSALVTRHFCSVFQIEKRHKTSKPSAISDQNSGPIDIQESWPWDDFILDKWYFL